MSSVDGGGDEFIRRVFLVLAVMEHTGQSGADAFRNGLLITSPFVARFDGGTVRGIELLALGLGHAPWLDDELPLGPLDEGRGAL